MKNFPYFCIFFFFPAIPLFSPLFLLSSKCLLHHLVFSHSISTPPITAAPSQPHSPSSINTLPTATLLSPPSYSLAPPPHSLSDPFTKTHSISFSFKPAISALRAHNYHLFGNALATSDFFFLSSNSSFTLFAPTDSALFSLDMTSSDSNYGSVVIIAVLDTGIRPECRSFSDLNLDPIPARWKAVCETGPGFPASSCNKKIAGARFFSKGHDAAAAFGGAAINETAEFRSPRDVDGHDTHTVSTAAGRHVFRARMEGCTTGVAKGVASKARIPARKVCWKADGCLDLDTLAGNHQTVPSKAAFYMKESSMQVNTVFNDLDAPFREALNLLDKMPHPKLLPAVPGTVVCHTQLSINITLFILKTKIITFPISNEIYFDNNIDIAIFVISSSDIATTLSSQASNLTSQQPDLAEIKSTLRKLSQILTEIFSKLSSYHSPPPSPSVIAAPLQTQPYSLIQPPSPTHFASPLSKIDNLTNLSYDTDISGTSVPLETVLPNNIDSSAFVTTTINNIAAIRNISLSLASLDTVVSTISTLVTSHTSSLANSFISNPSHSLFSTNPTFPLPPHHSPTSSSSLLLSSTVLPPPRLLPLLSTTALLFPSHFTFKSSKSKSINFVFTFTHNEYSLFFTIGRFFDLEDKVNFEGTAMIRQYMCMLPTTMRKYPARNVALGILLFLLIIN